MIGRISLGVLPVFLALPAMAEPLVYLIALFIVTPGAGGADSLVGRASVIEGGAVPRCPIIDALFDAAAVRPS